MLTRFTEAKGWGAERVHDHDDHRPGERGAVAVAVAAAAQVGVLSSVLLWKIERIFR